VTGTDAPRHREPRPEAWHLYLLRTRDGAIYTGIATDVARRIAEHVLAGCTDLSHLPHEQSDLVFVSLFDDIGDVWQTADYGLVEQCSEIAHWSRPDEFERILKAA